MELVHIDEINKVTLRSFVRNPYEVNGQISVENGKVSNITNRKGQNMKPCMTGCLLNFHTHPPDYETLYPDHPSATDFKYIHTATCKLSELSAHIICTPMYLYVVYYKCNNTLRQIYDFFTIHYYIDKKFNELSETFDRSTEDFRIEYKKEMEFLGFKIHRFNWSDDIVFEVPKFRSGVLKKIILVAILGLSFFFIKKYIM